MGTEKALMSPPCDSPQGIHYRSTGVKAESSAGHPFQFPYSMTPSYTVNIFSATCSGF